MARKYPRTAELYRTRRDSLAAVDTAGAYWGVGAVPESQETQCPYEWSRGGRAGAYPSCAGSEQLGDQWRGHAPGDEANLIGVQDDEASYSPAARSPAETQRQRGWRRLGFRADLANRLV